MKLSPNDYQIVINHAWTYLLSGGGLLPGVLGAIAEFEKERIRERVLAGLQRARSQGKRLGRPRKAQVTIAIPGGSVREAARIWGVSKSTAARWISTGRTPSGQSSAAA